MDDLAEMLKTMEPADVATMFAGARGSVPIYSGLYSKDASGPDELAFEARNRATSTAQRDAAASAAMQQQALQQIPEEALRKAVAARMREESQYPPALATRRADFVPQPRHEMRAAPVAPVQQRRAFNKGGGVKKTLQQMADSLLLRGVKTADKPDLARRSLFGLKAQPALDLPLARIDDIEKSLTKDMGKDLAKAPAITEKTVTVDPGKGAAKSTLQSISETPMSRRAVLSAAAGQVLRGLLPGVGDVVPTPDILSEIAKIVDVAKPVQAAAAALPVTLESVLAGAIGQGIKQKEAVQLARLQFPDYEPGVVKDIYKTLKDPYKNVDLDGDDADLADLLDTSRPAENMKMFTGAPSESPLYAMRPYMRALKQASPTVYDTAKAYSKDTAMDSVEGMAQSGLLRNEDEIARFLRNDPSIFDLIARRQ
jgi:hypothetical protein